MIQYFQDSRAKDNNFYTKVKALLDYINKGCRGVSCNLRKPELLEKCQPATQPIKLGALGIVKIFTRHQSRLQDLTFMDYLTTYMK